MTRCQLGVLFLQTCGVCYRYLDFSPSSNICEVSILNIVNELLFSRRRRLNKGFLIDECHHEGGLAHSEVTKHDKVEDMILFHL